MINNNVLSFSLRKNKKCHQKAQKTVLWCDQHFWWLPWNPWNHRSFFIITPSYTWICWCNPSSVHVGLFALVTTFQIYILYIIYYILYKWFLRNCAKKNKLQLQVYTTMDFPSELRNCPQGTRNFPCYTTLDRPPSLRPKLHGIQSFEWNFTSFTPQNSPGGI